MVSTQFHLSHFANCAFVSLILSKDVDDSLNDKYLISYMQLEVDQCNR